MQNNSTELTPDAMVGMQRKAIDQGVLLCWAIYDHPIDYPTKVVIRPWHANVEGAPRPVFAVVIADSISDARALVRRLGITRMPRYSNDDPGMLEAWI